MALFLGAKGDILAWRGTSELVAGLKALCADKMASLDAGEELELFRELEGRIAGEVAHELDFSTAFANALSDLERADYGDLLPPLQARFDRLAADYFRRRGSVVALHSLCNTYRDGIVRKALELAEQGMELELLGKPPAPYCLMTTGVAGRLEQTISVAADYFLVHAGSDAQTTHYFTQFAYRVMAILEFCGMLRGRQRKKPGDTFWHGPVAEWQSWINRELFPERRAERHDLSALPSLTVSLKPLPRENEERHRILARLADLRAIRCDDPMADELAGIVRGVLARERGSAAQEKLARKIADMPVALGFFGGFRTEKHGEQAGKINMELYVIAPLIMNVRILAIKHGIEATATVDRIKELLNKGHVNVELADRLLKAYHEFIRQKILLEIDQEAIRKNGWFLDPEKLSADDEQRLKNGLESVVNLQKIVYLTFVEQG